MSIAVLADDDQWEEINRGVHSADYRRLGPHEKIPAGAIACLLLEEGLECPAGVASIPVLINAVCLTLQESKAADNIIRINGWKTFLANDAWEMAGTVTGPVREVFAALGKKMVQVPDEPGFVSARIISMIINEAYFALGDKVSTREAIDLAMKLGTGYPYGPFEWAALIGPRNIFALLQKLSRHDASYSPATLLKEAATQ